MAKSLQEQLRHSGLASDQQLRKAKTEKRSKRQRGEQASDVDAKQAAAQAASLKAARDRELNLERQRETERRADAARLRQIIDAHAIPREAGETPYRFSDEGRVTSLYMDDTMRAGVVSGRLAIARLDSDYHVLTASVAERIASSYPQAIVVHHRPDRPLEADADDPYAGYEVPDDLVW